MSTNNKLVKDYQGNLISKSEAHSIMGKYYLENESCFLMEDGQWYRITSSDKITFDNYTKKYVLNSSTKLIKGVINVKGEEGSFSENDDIVVIRKKEDRRSGITRNCLNAEIAEKLEYIESISDGFFYLKSEITQEDLTGWFNKKSIPSFERSKSYNLESDPERKKELQKIYDNLSIKISPISKKISKYIGKYTFGMEAEVINGHIPKRIRSKFGIKALKDGSLRYDGGEGIEYVTMPMSGAKGIEVIKKFCSELSKRCEVNNLCSVHFHFGNVRKDKLYVISLYRTIMMIQGELQTYFPYSRFNSVRPDGKVYCKLLENLGIGYDKLLNQKSEEDFHKTVVNEFDKIYKWLNNGKGLAEVFGEAKIVRENTIINGKKMFCDKWLKTVFTTKSTNHSVQGQKWDKPCRYVNVNFLNLFFSSIGTIEFRMHEGSTSSTKCLIWMVICASILKYAEDIKRGLSCTSLKLSEILYENVDPEYTAYIMEYLNFRNSTFFTKEGSYRGNYKAVESAWFNKDPEFSFKYNNIEIK